MQQVIFTPISKSIQPSIIEDIYKQLDNKVDKDGSKVLSTNDYTTTEKDKLAGIAVGAETNQNAYSIIDIDGETIQAALPQDTIFLISGDNITLSKEDNKIRIAGKDTTYTLASSAVNGLLSSSDKVKIDNLSTTFLLQNQTVPQNNLRITLDENFEVNIDNNLVNINLNIPLATSEQKGLMSNEDKIKLDSINTDEENWQPVTQTGLGEYANSAQAELYEFKVNEYGFLTYVSPIDGVRLIEKIGYASEEQDGILSMSSYQFLTRQVTGDQDGRATPDMVRAIEDLQNRVQALENKGMA